MSVTKLLAKIDGISLFYWKHNTQQEIIRGRRYNKDCLTE